METKKPGQSVLTDTRKGRSYKSNKTAKLKLAGANEVSSPKL
jgi:hypothetical protein